MLPYRKICTLNIFLIFPSLPQSFVSGQSSFLIFLESFILCLWPLSVWFTWGSFRPLVSFDSSPSFYPFLPTPYFTLLHVHSTISSKTNKADTLKVTIQCSLPPTILQSPLTYVHLISRYWLTQKMYTSLTGLFHRFWKISKPSYPYPFTHAIQLTWDGHTSRWPPVAIVILLVFLYKDKSIMFNRYNLPLYLS